MKRVLSHAKPYVKECILGPLFKLAEACLELMVPLIMADLIDKGIALQDDRFVLAMSVRLILQGIGGLGCALVAQYFAAKAATGITAGLKHTLFSHIQSFSHADLDRVGTSTLVSRLTGDMDRLQSGINLTLRLLLRSPFVVFGAAIMAFTVDVKSALIFAVIIPILSIIVFGIMLITMPMFKKVQGRTDTVLSRIRENLTGVRVMRAFCREEEESAGFTEENTALTKLQKRVGAISALMNPLTYTVINLGIIALLQIGAISVYEGDLSTGQVVAQYNYLSLILTELIKMANMIISLTKAMACATRIEATLKITPSLTDSAASTKETGNAAAPAVTFQNVSLCYSTGAPSLFEISFSVPAGSTVGIVGGTGSGKTSLASLINRSYDATQGQVLLGGVNVKEIPLATLRARIGIVPQHPLLFRGSVRENLLYGNPDASDADIALALRTAQAEEVVNRMENGLDTEITQGGKNLSGGQRQRLTIARALVKQPEILILDDASSALDFATDRDLRRALQHLPGSPTVFLISQRTSSVKHADQILVLEDGKLVGIGTHETLLTTCPVYREIHAACSGEEVSA